MRILELPAHLTVLLDIALWFAIHLGMSWLVQRMPDQRFAVDNALFRTRRWEQGGQVYQRLFAIRRWKHRLPDGAACFSEGFTKSSLSRHSREYLARFALETRRAELAHWPQILAVPLFFFFNEPWVSAVMVLYALAANLPCIMAQRHNRPRLLRSLALAERSGPSTS
ncbi:MAG: hypothetical protein QHH05_04600 [Syntrophomonadaceae bacterium]|jgi:glycosyl-4,4'-diaponeurosporenoate acyltransferase|nr:hypothetical protein [Syntrophomonadaceae bacterium]MDH7497704.1 hypothetical protein [Syntrophomonadaceae bacterium]